MQPCDVTTWTVLHMPFLIEATIDATPGSLAAAHARALAPRRDVPKVLPWLTDSFDLALQEYSAEVQDELRRYLPCRVWEQSLSFPGRGEDALQPMPDVAIQWKPVRAVASIWNLGVGVITAVYSVEIGRAVSWTDYLASIDEVNTKAKGEWRQRAHDATLAYREESRKVDRTQQARGEMASPFDPLWSHTLCIVETEPDTDLKQLAVIATKMAPDGSSYKLRLESKEIPLQLGLTACVAFPRGFSQAAAATSRLIGVHTAIWARALDFDRLLFRQLAEITETPSSSSLTRLEEQLDELLHLHGLIQRFRSGLDYLPVHLSAIDGALWKALYERWGLKLQFDALDQKLDALTHAHADLASRISGRRARRLTGFGLIFTLLGLITTGTTVINFLRMPVGKLQPGNIRLVLALVLLAVSLGAGLSLYLYLWKGRRAHAR